MKKRRLIWISILLLVVISAAWFGRDTQVPGLQLAPINWAVTGDFDNDPAAQAMLRGLEIFIANTNQSGGYQGHPIQLLRFNQAPQAQAKPDDDIIATINNSDALAVIGQHGDIKAAARAYHLYKIPFIAPLSTAPGLTEFNEWTFRLNYDDVQQSTALVQYVKRILQRNKLILLSNKRDRLHGALSQAAQNAGLQFELIAPDDMLVKLDSASAISAIKGETANSALVLALPAKPAKEITRRLRDQHLDAEIIAVNALASPSFLNSFSDLAAEQRQRGFYTDGLHFPQPLVADNMPTAAREILDAAGHDSLHDMTWPVLYGYDAGVLLYQALQHFDAVLMPIKDSRQLIRDTLAASGIASATGLSGLIGFDGDGAIPRQVMMAQAFRGIFVSAPRQQQGEQIQQRVQTGVQFLRVHHIDNRAKTFSAEFKLWFRYDGEFQAEDIVFPNAVTPITLTEPEQRLYRNGWQYVLYSVKGDFRYQIEPYNLIHGVYDLALRFYHGKHDDAHLRFVIDNWGMALNNNQLWKMRVQQQRVFDKAWHVLDAGIMQISLRRSSLGDPLIAVQTLEHAGISANFRVQQVDYALSRQIRSWLPSHLNTMALTGILILFVLSWLPWLHRDHPLLARLQRLSIGTFLFYLFEQFLLRGIALKLELLPLQWLLTALQICWWLVPALWINRLLPLLVWQPIERRTHYGVPDIAKTFVSLSIYALSGLAVAYYVFEQSLTSIWAASGVLAVVLGFALRSLILDAFTGLTLNAERPFQLEHWIELSNTDGSQLLGRVEEMNWRTTRLWTREGNLVIVPNNAFGDAILVNYSQPLAYSRLSVFIHLDFSVPLARALRILEAAALAALDAKQGLLSEPPPRVLLEDADEQGILYRLLISHNVSKSSVIMARSRVLSTLMSHLRQSGLKPGMPKRDIHIGKRMEEMDWLKGKHIEHLLRLNRLFASLTDEECLYLASKLRVSLFNQDEVVIHQGEPGDSMFGLGEGLLSVFVSPQGNGEEIKVADMEPGSFFGEMSLLTGEPRSATVKAASASVIYEIRREDIKNIFVKRPEIVDSISHVIAQRKLDTNRALDEAATLSEREKAIDGAAAVLIKRVCTVFGIELGRERSP